MNLKQLINNEIFCATTRVYALISLLSDDCAIIYINVKEIMNTLDLSDNTIRAAINKLIENNLIEMSETKKHIVTINTKENNNNNVIKERNFQ